MTSQIKPTHDNPSTPHAKQFEKDLKHTMNKQGVNLNEVDKALNEKEQSLKKKIFDLAKMEALVHSDPKLSAVYDGMAEDGEEKYGYHHNETIMNMIFNDYVLNSPKYLQKYKQAIPKKKKRRDKYGIDQLRKGDKKKDVNEQEERTRVVFLVNENDPENPDVFAYFPDDIHKGKYRTSYSHVGQHSACHPDYAKESRMATPEEYKDLKNELENQVGYNLEIVSNGMFETTSSGGSGSYAQSLGYNRKKMFEQKEEKEVKDEEEEEVDESATTASVGGAGMGSGGYVQPAIWSKDGKPARRKPLYPGGTVIGETYLTNPEKFHMIYESLDMNEVLDRKIESYDELKALLKAEGRKLNKQDVPLLAGDALYNVAVHLADKLLPMRWDDLPDINSMWDYIDEKGGMSFENLVNVVKEAVNDRLAEEGFGLDDLMESAINEHHLETRQEKIDFIAIQFPKVESQMKEKLSQASDDLLERLYNVFEKSMGLVKEHHLDTRDEKINFILQNLEDVSGVDKDILETLPDTELEQMYIDTEQSMGLYEKIDENGQGGNEEKIYFIKRAYKVMSGNRYDEDMIFDELESLSDKELHKIYTKMVKILPSHGISPDSIINEDLPEKINEDVVEYDSDRDGEEPFEMGGIKYQFVNAIYPDGKRDIGVYRYDHDLVYDYESWKELYNIKENKKVMENKIQEHHLDTTKEKIEFIKKAFYILTDELERNPERDKIQDEFLTSLSDEDIQRIYLNHEERLREIGVDPMTLEIEKTEEPAHSEDDHEFDIKETTDQSMLDDNPESLSNKPNPVGDLGSNVEVGARGTGGGMNEELDEINEELDNLINQHKEAKDLFEDRKPSAIVLKDRVGGDNQKNFKKDMKDSVTKDVIKTEKQLGSNVDPDVDDVDYKEQQTQVNEKNPYKDGEDIEKDVLKKTKGEAFKNVGNSANKEGDEVPKRNLTTDEQDEVDLYRKGLGDYVYDNEPSERFEERMKKDMGDDLYEKRKKKMEFQAKAPMYNKDTEPVGDGIDKVQYNKNKSGWADRFGIKESKVTGKYFDQLNRKRFIDFKLNEVKVVEKPEENWAELDFAGMGNKYDVNLNETKINNALNENFYTDGKNVWVIENKETLTEGEKKVEKPKLDEGMEKMKHFMNYNPGNFTDTKNIKRNRGF